MTPNERSFRLSLVVATLGRTDELSRLFRSLAEQSVRDFEVIVVDQNEDDRLLDVIVPFSRTLEIVHVKTARKGVCRARNLGAAQARGEWLMFPDDDCWYPGDLLERYFRLTDRMPANFYCGRATNAAGATIMGQFDTEATTIDRGNVWTTMIEWMLLVRRSAFAAAGGFDEKIGPGSGTPWGAYEIQDLALTLIERGERGYYDPSLFGHHPEDGCDQTVPENIAKIRRYSAGLGYVMRKHRFGAAGFLPRLLRPIAGMAIYALTLRPDMARRSQQILIGRWDGWRTSAGVVLPAQDILTYQR